MNTMHSLLRIYVGESDLFHQKPVYEIIVLKARETGLSGATVFKGIMGFGHASVIHTSKILRLSEDMPMLIEIVDVAEKIELFIPFVQQLMRDSNSHGIITREKAEVIAYRD